MPIFKMLFLWVKWNSSMNGFSGVRNESHLQSVINLFVCKRRFCCICIMWSKISAHTVNDLYQFENSNILRNIEYRWPKRVSFKITIWIILWKFGGRKMCAVLPFWRQKSLNTKSLLSAHYLECAPSKMVMVFGAWILLEYSLNFISTNQHDLCILLGVCSFRDGDYLSEFVRAEQKKWEIEKSTDKSLTFSFHFEFNVTLSLKDTVSLA